MATPPPQTDPEDCPATGTGGIVPAGGASCHRFTPITTGADSSGENATYPQYGLAPASNPKGELVLFTNGTCSHPTESVPDASQNFYNAAVSLGYHVLAVSYLSNETIAAQCGCVDGCYLPSRQAVITGTFVDNGSCDLQGVRVDESIAGRAALALQWLAANYPADGWSAYLTTAKTTAPPDQQIAWSKIVTAGHSQGGGHAAAIGKLYPVRRVVQLSSACDVAFPTLADCSHSDPSNASPASWLERSNGTWATPASAYWGLDIKTVYNGDTYVSGDGACFEHLAIWGAEGVPAAQQNDDDAICGATTIAENHDASIGCPDNYANWQAMLQ